MNHQERRNRQRRIVRYAARHPEVIQEKIAERYGVTQEHVSGLIKKYSDYYEEMKRTYEHAHASGEQERS